MPDIAFLFPPSAGAKGGFSTHLGVGYLRARLASEGIESTQFLSDRPGVPQDVASAVLNQGPKVVGFTVYDSNLIISLNIAERIRREAPDTWIVFGGPTATFSSERILERFPFVDACFLGEAEETGRSVVRLLLGATARQRAPAELAGVPGVAFARGDGTIISTGMAPLAGVGPPSAHSLDTLPSPYLTGMLTGGTAGVLTSRGCVSRCVYCSLPTLAQNKLRVHSDERVLAELEVIAATTADRHAVVSIHDDAFTMIPERAKSLCERIASKNVGLRLGCITRADRVDEELLRLMKSAGIAALAFGLESAVPSVLRACGKVSAPDSRADFAAERDFLRRIRKYVTLSKKLGFLVGVSIIVGLPGETREDAEKTLAFVRTLPIDFYMHNVLQVFPGAPLWGNCSRHGINVTRAALGVLSTTSHAYDAYDVAPTSKCGNLVSGEMVRSSAVEWLGACRPRFDCGSGFSAVVVRSSVLEEDTASWLADVLGIGGTVMQVLPAKPPSERHLARQFNETRLRLMNARVPCSAYVLAAPVAELRGAIEYRVHTDKFCRSAHGIGVETVWWGRSAGRTITRLASARPRSVYCDIVDASAWMNGSPRTKGVPYGDGMAARRVARLPNLPVVAYADRWIGAEVPCREGKRIEVDAGGGISVCLHGDRLGSVGDPESSIRDGVAQAARSARVRRNCEACDLKNTCPKCPFPGVSDAQYCGIVRERRREIRDLQWIQVFRGLGTAVDEFVYTG